MKRVITYVFLSIFVIMPFVFQACDGLDEHYSTNPNLRLTFSTDTLTFDTVFTTVGSATKQFVIYNNNDESLNMETVMLAGAGSTGFRINVDGRKGDYFNDVGILSKDSMFVFVEVTVNPNGENQPLLVQDSVIFITNGIRQSVLLEAYGQDVHMYKGGLYVMQDTVFSADKPHLVYDSIVVAPNATMRVEKGATFYMHDRADIIVNGQLNSCGTLDEPVTFRGDRLDFILDDVLPYDRTPGQWGGIYLKDGSFGNVISHTIIRNGTQGVIAEPSSPDELKLTLSNSQITNVSENAFCATNCHIMVYNTEISNAGGSVVGLVCGEYDFIHCTLANFITLVERSSVCLSLSNNYSKDGQETIQSLNARFDNCIIDGSYGAGTEELNGEIACSVKDGGAFDFLFNHCVITTNGSDNENFQSVLFVDDDTRPEYKLTGGESNKYRYDFRLASAESAGVGAADPSVTSSYPMDRYGVNRLESEYGPTIGAYEYVPDDDTGE